MKRILFGFLMSISLLLSATTFAQSPSQDLALIQSIVGKVKQDVVSDYMNLNQEDSDKFWALYEPYEISRQEIVAKNMKNIDKYASTYDDLTPEFATKVAHSTLQSSLKSIKLEEKYLGKMSKSIGGINATKFIMLESYLRSLVTVRVLEGIAIIDSIQQ